MLLDLLKNVAPGLATAVGGPMAGMAVKAIADKLGCAPDETSVASAIQNDPAAAMKLAEIDLKQFEAEAKDRADARAMQVQAMQSEDPLVRRFVYYFIAFWSLFAAAFLPTIVFLQIPEENIRFVDTILGFMLGTMVSSMFAFLLGSSLGSRNKDKK